MALLVAIHTAAALVVWPLQLPGAAKAALVTLIATSLARSLWRHALLKARSAIVAIALNDCENVSVRIRNGACFDARVLGTSYVSPALTALNLRVGGLRLVHHVLVVPDNTDCEDFRRLRVLLRWGYRKKTSVRRHGQDEPH